MQIQSELSAAKSRKAAAYARMSTDQQRYSIDNQLDAIHRYAVGHALDLVEIYTDAGKSGLRIQNREGLKSLIRDVVSGDATFSVLLVYDVSRWGRFQDIDEAAHYEFLLRQAGITIIYCGEQFENDGSAFSNLVKSLKRTMAAEYSRELSAKVFTGQLRIAKLGYIVGGAAPYGLRRQMVSEAGKPIATMEATERKCLSTARVILVRGPPDEVAVVQRIFRMFADDNLSRKAIADRLNSDAIPAPAGGLWAHQVICYMLENERYAGHSTFNRASNHLRARKKANPRQLWVRVEDAFEAIVDRDTFDRAQARMKDEAESYSADRLLEQLRNFVRVNGHISVSLIDHDADLPWSHVIQKRFGSLLRAYDLIGYAPPICYDNVPMDRRNRFASGDITDTVCRWIIDLGGSVKSNRRTRNIQVAPDTRMNVIVLSHSEGRTGKSHWNLKVHEKLDADVILVARMGEGNHQLLDYYLIPRSEFPKRRLNMYGSEGRPFSQFRMANLNGVQPFLRQALSLAPVEEQAHLS